MESVRATVLVDQCPSSHNTPTTSSGHVDVCHCAQLVHMSQGHQEGMRKGGFFKELKGKEGSASLLFKTLEEMCLC